MGTVFFLWVLDLRDELERWSDGVMGPESNNAILQHSSTPFFDHSITSTLQFVACKSHLKSTRKETRA